MRDGVRMMCAGVIASLALVLRAPAQQATPPDGDADLKKPLALSLQPAPEPETVYAPPSPRLPEQGINEGAVHFQLAVAYFTDYVYRGIEIFEPPGGEDRANLQIDSKLSWDLGKLPHPYLAVFVNYADSDPISSFQEIRPAFGADWNLRPLILSAGNNTYLYPNRNQFETSEVYGKIQIDDSYFLRTDKPILSPYIYAAYDYDRYNGWYFEAGISHDFEIADTGLTFTANAQISYVQAIELYEARPGDKHVSGFQHYQVGLIANYSINTLFNFPPRYGDWSIQGFLYYTDGLDNDLRSTTQLWGGTGIMFKY
jgi:hypothetical protein